MASALTESESAPGADTFHYVPDPKHPNPQCSSSLSPMEMSQTLDEERHRPSLTDTVDEYRVLVIGKTGNGKSSLCNLLTRSDQFKVGRGLHSTTTEAFSCCIEVNMLGKKVKIIDTPDFTNLSEQFDEANQRQHIHAWKKLNPHAVILVVRCDVRFTKEEHAIYRQIKALWEDEDFFRQNLMLAFTFGDMQDEDLETELEGVCDDLRAVLTEARYRFVQVNNRARGEDRDAQRERIYEVLDKVLVGADVQGSLDYNGNSYWQLLLKLWEFMNTYIFSPITSLVMKPDCNTHQKQVSHSGEMV